MICTTSHSLPVVDPGFQLPSLNHSVGLSPSFTTAAIWTDFFNTLCPIIPFMKHLKTFNWPTYGNFKMNIYVFKSSVL